MTNCVSRAMDRKGNCDHDCQSLKEGSREVIMTSYLLRQTSLSEKCTKF